jgi:hypothetical protein
MKKKPPVSPVSKVAAIVPSRPGDCADWASYDVVSGNDRRPMAEVLEVTETECTRYKRGADGKLLTNGGNLVVETVRGSFEVRKR